MNRNPCSILILTILGGSLLLSCDASNKIEIVESEPKIVKEEESQHAVIGQVERPHLTAALEVATWLDSVSVEATGGTAWPADPARGEACQGPNHLPKGESS